MKPEQLERLVDRLTEAQVDFYAQLGIIDPRDLQQELDGFGFYPQLVPPYYRDSTKRGEAIPVYLTEQELKLIRDRSRRTCVENEFALCALENRVNYVVGKGFDYKASSDDPQLAAAAQRVIDAFLEYNEWAEVEAEVMRRLDIDGEAFLRFFPQQNGVLAARFVEPEHVKSPTGGNYGARYSFGIETDEDDVETVRAYWIVYNPTRNPFPDPVPQDEVIHVKLNTHRNAKRGLPTFYPVEGNLRRAEQLLASMVSMANTRAKVALIRHVNGALKDTTNALVQQLTSFRAQDPRTGEQANVERMRYGTILTSSGNIEYEFPQAGIDAANFVQVLQAELRGIASRLIMPEWMFTTDASNANFSSSLIAEAPAVKNFERLQRLLARKMGEGRFTGKESAVWRQIRYAVQCRILPPEALHRVKVEVTAPSLVVRDEAGEATTNKTYLEMGVKSKQTIQAELGLDAQNERRNLQQDPPTQPQQKPPPGANPADGQPQALPAGQGVPRS